MIVYPLWETTPSPQLQAEVKPKKKKKKIISTQQKAEQLPLFIDDYASENKVKISQLNNLTLDDLLSKLTKTIHDIDSKIESNSLVYEKDGKIPFPKIDLNKHLAKYKVLETFDNSIYLKAYTAADNLSNSVGVAKVKVQVQKDELPPALIQMPSGMSLSNQEVADLFGIPPKDLLSVSVEMASDGSDPFSDIEPIYTVTFERLIPKDGDIF
jgi:hypothetical protein